MLPKNTQYLIAGAIGLYIVLMTRPAPAMITNLLASSVAQIAALALVIYVGATQSLIVAVVLAVAVVMSTPSREYMTVEEKKKVDKKAPATKKPAAKPMKDLGKEATKPAKPTPSTAEPKPANVSEPAESGEPAAAGQSLAEGVKKESFSLMNAADF
jgi:outer membrane biosynthesis protein TonB